MNYTHAIVPTIAEVDWDDWNQLRSGPQDLYMDPRFLSAAEAALAGPSRFWYVLIYDESRRPVAVACVCLFLVDAAILGQDWLKSAAVRIRSCVGSFLYLPVLFCGLPVSCGQSHLRIAPDADVDTVLEQLNAILDRLASEHRAWLIVFKEFSTEQTTQLETLAQRGFLRADSLPMNHFDAGFGSFEEFCGALRAHYRYKFRRSQRKFARRGFEVQQLEGEQILDVYTDEVHALYEAVVDRSPHKLEILPADFFRQLVRRMPEEVRLMVVWHEQRVVAFSWGLLTPHRYQNMFIGIDYTLNNESDLYFNVMARSLDFALKAGVQEILVGQSADEFKSRLGCQREPLYIFAKSNRILVNWIMRRFSSWFFPASAPVNERRLLREAPAVVEAGSETAREQEATTRGGP